MNRFLTWPELLSVCRKQGIPVGTLSFCSPCSTPSRSNQSEAPSPANPSLDELRSRAEALFKESATKYARNKQ